MGHLVLVVFVLLLQTVALKEIQGIRIAGLKAKKQEAIPLFKFIDWYFFFALNYTIYIRVFITRFESALYTHEILGYLARHHSLICFSLFVLGLVIFVLTLRKGMFKAQFVQLAWTIVTLIFVVFSSSFHVSNIFEGLFWFLLPALLVITNDVFAYIWGSLLGRTKLIEHISPNKTWEGFIGASISTCIMALFISYWLAQFSWFTCPKIDLWVAPTQCVPEEHFILKTYDFPTELTSVLHLVGITWSSITFYPVQLHALALAVFASIIAPFGGFFASGFKRAYKIKDFASTIPGHGGIVDRMDCQAMMGGFAYFYVVTVVKNTSPTVVSLLDQILTMSPENQRRLYELLHESLISRGLITP